MPVSIHFRGLHRTFITLGFLTIVGAACSGGDKPKGDNGKTKVEITKAETEVKEEVEQIEEEANDGVEDGAASAAEAPANSETGDAKATEGEAGAKAETGDTKAEEDPLPGLLKEIKSKRTKDDRALAALGEAEAAGAELEDLTKAANKRGESLHADPDRAKKFFEWAAEKDPKYAKPMFNLAKQAVNSGDVAATRDYLVKTRERKGGKKLLKQIEFDPMWEIVKDDPEVKKLLK